MAVQSDFRRRIRPSLVRIYLRARRHEGLVALGLIPLAGVLIVCLRLGADPVYRFDLDRVAAPADVRSFLDAGDEIRRLRSWSPGWVSGESANVLAQLIQLPENSSAKGLIELVRLEAPADSDLNLSGQVAALNGLVQMLAPRIGGERYRALRALPAEDLRSELQNELDAIEDQRAIALGRLLNGATLAPLIERYGVSYPAEPPGTLRRLTCWLTELRPVDEWYGREWHSLAGSVLGHVAGQLRCAACDPACSPLDPELTIDFRERGLWIGGKFTPPWPLPLSAMTGESGSAEQLLRGWGLSPTPSRPVRLYNPWLHVVFLEGRLGGSLHDRELSADAEVRLLERFSAAHAHLSCNLNAKIVHAALQARPVPAGLGQELSGELWLTGSGELEMDGTVRVAGCAVDGRLRFQPPMFPGQAPEAMVRGTATLPLVGRAEVHGISDVTFQDPQISASGELQGLIGEPVQYRFRANRGGYEFTYGILAAHGPALHAVAGPSLDSVDEDALRRDVQKTLAALKPSRRPTEAEISCIRRLRSALDVADENALAPVPDLPEEPSMERGPRPVAGLKWRPADGTQSASWPPNPRSPSSFSL